MHKEVIRLQKIYPLFSFEEKGNDMVTVSFSPNHSYNFKLQNGGTDHYAIGMMDKEHCQKSMSQDLMEMYPDLFISTSIGRDGVDIMAWVKRGNRDHEAIGRVHILSPRLHDMLLSWQLEAKEAKREGYFFCSGHIKAEPRSDYGYFYFAGNYCKQWGNEHPQHRLTAERETYN